MISLEPLSFKFTPAERKHMTKDSDGTSWDSSFSCASFVETLLEFLCLKRILPKSDEDPLKQIGRYLKLTQDKGIIMKPSINLRMMSTLMLIFLVSLDMKMSLKPLALEKTWDLSSMSLITLFFSSQNFRQKQC
ncbi:hypothetical protein ACHAXS_002039 [Conticribra weissflogii]